MSPSVIAILYQYLISITYCINIIVLEKYNVPIVLVSNFFSRIKSQKGKIFVYSICILYVYTFMNSPFERSFLLAFQQQCLNDSLGDAKLAQTKREKTETVFQPN